MNDSPADRQVLIRALDELVRDGVLIRYDYVDNGNNWQLTRNEAGEAYEFTIEQVEAYIAGVNDARDNPAAR